MNQRQSGILLHISSLPSRFGIGDLGPEAYRFVNFLSRTQQHSWQILPMSPTTLGHKNSPYSSPSAFAGNTLFISPEFLVKEGFLKQAELKPKPLFARKKVEYAKVEVYKSSLFQRAYTRFKARSIEAKGWEEFLKDHAFWLDEYALFVVMKAHFKGKMWSQWPEALKQREAQVLAEFRREFQEPIEEVKFLQYLFFKQWHDLKEYCHQKGIELIGDIPIYVTFDSVDVWTHPQYFKLDENLEPFVVAGVPPDYFSATGQRWGNPVYDWEKLKASGYQWWIERIKVNLELFDKARIDHFRGMVNYWEIPVHEETALNGYWVDVPTEDFFEKVKSYFRDKNGLPIIAEDLGIITDEVKAAMKKQGFPGMKILMFAFGDDDRNPYLPHNYDEDCVVYTGTHDNNTVQGWFERDIGDQERQKVLAYVGKDVLPEDIHWALIALAMKSKARLAIIPLQDILGLGQEARMNRPGTIQGNWQWRCLPEALNEAVAEKLLTLVKLREGTSQF